MRPFVALLRGINVGGNNILPMQDFRDILANLGCESVSTYIQSGNAVFTHSGDALPLSDTISAAIESGFGFRPSVLVLTANKFSAIATANPFATKGVEPKFVNTGFLSEPATNADTARIEEIADDSEKFLLTDEAFYLFAPNGIGRSKLAAGVEKCLGVASTGRNLRTVGKIQELLAAIS